jgi:hypothetical protein
MRHSVYRWDRLWNPAHLAREMKFRLKRLLELHAPGFYQTLRRRR